MSTHKTQVLGIPIHLCKGNTISIPTNIREYFNLKPNSIVIVTYPSDNNTLFEISAAKPNSKKQHYCKLNSGRIRICKKWVNKNALIEHDYVYLFLFMEKIIVSTLPEIKFKQH